MKECQAAIREVIERTPNVKSFRLAPCAWEPFLAGQWFMVTVDEAKKLSKPLSISSSPTEDTHLEFTKKITDSEFCKALCNLKPGDTIKIKYPFGKFTLRPEDKKIAFLSGGIGITPIRSMCKFCSDKDRDTDLVLLYANRTEKDIAFREDLDGFNKKCRRLKIVHVLSRADKSWSGRRGHIDAQVIREEIPDFTERRFYICGPPAMVEAMKKVLTDEIRLPKEQIITEDFKGY